MEPGARSLADRVEPGDSGIAVDLGLDPAAAEVGAGHDRDRGFGDIDPELMALGENAGKTLPQEIFAFVRHVEVGAGLPGAFEFAVDRAGDDIARGEAFHLVVFLHEFGIDAFGILHFERAAFAPKRLADEEVLHFRMVEQGRVELEKFHVRDGCERPVCHCDPGAAGHVGIAGAQVDFPAAAGGDRGGERTEGFDLSGPDVQHICAYADVVFQSFAHAALGDQVDGDMVFENMDPGIFPAGGDERAFHFLAGDVARMEDPPFVVSALAAEVVFVLVVRSVAELCAGGEMGPDRLREPLDPFRPGLDDLQGVFAVAEVSAGVERVGKMFIERVLAVGDAGDAALSETAVAVVDSAFGDDGDFSPAGFGQGEGAGESCQAAAYDQVIEVQFLFFCHFFRTFFRLRVLFFGLSK